MSVLDGRADLLSMMTYALYLCFRSLGLYAWNWCVLRSSHTLSLSYGTHAHICVLVWMWVGDLSEGEWPREDVSGEALATHRTQ